MAGSLLGAAVMLFGGTHVAAEPGSGIEGRIAFSFGDTGYDHPGQSAVIDGGNRRLLPPDQTVPRVWSPDGPVRLLPLYPVGIGSWSPDGRVLAVSSWYDSAGTSAIKVDERRAYDAGRLVSGVEPAWSRDGRSIAFRHAGGIWVLNHNDRRQRRIIRSGRLPSWSPDGRKLTFIRERRVPCPDREACENNPSLRWTDDLWLLDLATHTQRRLVSNDSRVTTEHPVRWSPDGRSIVFERCPDGTWPDCSIYVMRGDGTEPRFLFHGLGPVWSPDGKEIAISTGNALYRRRLTGGRWRRILFGHLTGVELIDWSPVG